MIFLDVYNNYKVIILYILKKIYDFSSPKMLLNWENYVYTNTKKIDVTE